MAEKIQLLVTTGVKEYKDTFRCQWRIQDYKTLQRHPNLINAQWFEFETGNSPNIRSRWRIGLKSTQVNEFQCRSWERKTPLDFISLVLLECGNDTASANVSVKIEPAFKPPYYRSPLIGLHGWLTPGEELVSSQTDPHYEPLRFLGHVDSEGTTTLNLEVNVSQYLRVLLENKTLSD